MFDSLKLRRLLATFQLAHQPRWRASLDSSLGYPSVVVNLHPYPSHYFIRNGEWFRVDVAHPGATAPVQVPKPSPVGIRANEPFQLVCLFALREVIDLHRRRAYPLTDEDYALLPTDWDLQIEERVRSMIDEYLAFVVFVGNSVPVKSVQDAAGGIIIEQRGQIGMFARP